MVIKIQCSCGTRYSFEVEPVNGWMPVRVKCPGCGADGTDAANDILRQSRAAGAPVPGPQPTPVPAQPPSPVAGSEPQTAAAPAAAAVCPRHPKNPPVETCRVCGKPMCGKCMEQFGYVCSAYCKSQAERLKMNLPVYGKQRAVVQKKQRWMGTLIWRAVIFLMVVSLGAWIWYAFFGSHPRVVYSEKIPPGDHARFYQLLVPNQLLSIKAGQMALFDLTEQRQLWSFALKSKTSPAALPSALADAGDEPAFYPKPHVIATANDLWILSPGRITQYDRHTGNSKQEIPLNPPFFGMAQNDGGITVISSDDAGREIITRIVLPGGTIQTEPVESVVVAPAPGGPIIAGPANAVESKAGAGERISLGDRYVPAGASVVQMKTGLIERKTIIHQAMKPQKKSLLEDNLTANQSVEASEQVFNDLHREQTGGVEEEDASRYQVTLRRCPANTAPDWTGEVIGSPTLFALKTLDVLVGAHSIDVFDQHNRKLWTASLTYPIAPHYSEDFATEADPPCVEAGGALYAFDKGMLTSFDAATGQVHWRLTSVGISQVQPDGKGNLYVTSTTASPDDIQFSQQVNFSSKTTPVILKVDAATGKVLWRAEGIADQCFLSGQFVYAARATVDPLSKLTPGQDPVLYFDLYRLNPSNGQTMWHYSQPHHPLQIEVQENQIMLHFRGELQVLKFLSL
jgi:hypothetical protein